MEAWLLPALLALLPLAFGAGEPPTEVPKPTNVIVESYNFNTSVHWDYKNITPAPVFIVELRCYHPNSVYREVDSCVNISQYYCDLTHEAEKCDEFWVRVKAVDGLQESSYTEPAFFRVINTHVRIGPPKLQLHIVDHEIKVVLIHPLTPYYYKKKPRSVRAKLEDFSYKVSLWRNGSQKVYEPEPEDCTSKNCTIDIPITSENTLYCVSAHGFSEIYDVKGEESNESCISLPFKHKSDLIIIIGVLLLLFLVAVLVIIFRCMQKKNIKLPKSLAAVVKSKVNSFETNEEPKNFSLISSLSNEVLLTNEDEKFLEQVDVVAEVKATDLSTSNKEMDPYDSEGALNKTEGLSIQEDVIVEISEREKNPGDSENYSKSISDQEEMENTVPYVDLPKEDVVQPTRCRNISGYDKPHWKNSVSEVHSMVT